MGMIATYGTDWLSHCEPRGGVPKPLETAEPLVGQFCLLALRIKSDHVHGQLAGCRANEGHFPVCVCLPICST